MALYNNPYQYSFGVPRGCCVNIAVENTSDQAISVANANVIVTREA